MPAVKNKTEKVAGRSPRAQLEAFIRKYSPEVLGRLPRFGDLG